MVEKKIVAAVVVAAALAGATWFFLRRPAPAPAPPPVAPVAAQPRAPDSPLPPSAESDVRVRDLFGALSPRLREWLSGTDLLERGATVIDNLAEGVSPVKQLTFLTPKEPYQPHRFERYDSFADVIASVDARALATALRTIHPLLEAAYHKLGYPDRALSATLQAALQRIVDAPALGAGDAEVQPRGQHYVYVDPKLEALGPVEKHLLRLGPRNEKLVQDQARALLAALKQQ